MQGLKHELYRFTPDGTHPRLLSVPRRTGEVAMNCTIASEDAFGPQARACYGGYDFTLLFEESVMTIGPIGLLLLCLFPRVVYLYRKSLRDGSKDCAYTAKLVGHNFYPTVPESSSHR